MRSSWIKILKTFQFRIRVCYLGDVGTSGGFKMCAIYRRRSEEKEKGVKTKSENEAS